MSRKSAYPSIESKLKPNQKLSCSGCYLIFESVISAAEHTIYCKKKGMEGKQQKRRKVDFQPQIKIQKTDAGIASGRVTVSVHWSKRNVALLLKCIYNRIHLFSSNDSNDSAWQEVGTEMKKQFSWVFSSLCRTKWKNLKEEMENYLLYSVKRETGQQCSIAKPDFFYIVREISRRMDLVKDALPTDPADTTVKFEKDEEELDCTPEEDLMADPDAIEEEPFAGVMDSQGNMHMREVLLEVVQSIEMDENCSDAVVGQRHGVEEAVVEWVRENRESVVKGTLRCSICKQRILKREEYVNHELDCILNTEVTGSVEDSGGYVFTYNKEKEDSLWTAPRTSALITVFRQRASSFVSPEGFLRKGIWLEIYNELKPKHPDITPQACCDKWTSLVKEAREYCSKKKANEKVEDKTATSIRILPLRPAFFNEVASIVDLNNVGDNPQSFVPKELLSVVKEEQSSNCRDNEGDNNPEEAPDDAIGVSNDSFEETLSVGESSDGEPDEDERFREREKDSWGMRVRLGDVERKVKAMGERLKELDDNLALRQGGVGEGRDQLTQLVSRMDQFLHTQNRLQTQQTEALTKVIAMSERHHRENLSVMKALVQEVSKKKFDAREKKSK